jgi:hypothetical protein
MKNSKPLFGRICRGGGLYSIDFEANENATGVWRSGYGVEMFRGMPEDMPVLNFDAPTVDVSKVVKLIFDCPGIRERDGYGIELSNFINEARKVGVEVTTVGAVLIRSMSIEEQLLAQRIEGYSSELNEPQAKYSGKYRWSIWKVDIGGDAVKAIDTSSIVVCGVYCNRQGTYYVTEYTDARKAKESELTDISRELILNWKH